MWWISPAGRCAGASPFAGTCSRSSGFRSRPRFSRSRSTARRHVESPPDGWPEALAEVAALFVIQLVLFQLAEEIGFTGFLQDRWQDRFSPLRLTAYVAFFWALWHVPDHFGEEGWGLEQLVAAPIVLVIEFVSLFFARALFVWLYARTGRSVLLVAVMHASFDASISELSHDVVPGSNAVRFLLFSGVIVLAGTAVIVLTRGRFANGHDDLRPVTTPT